MVDCYILDDDGKTPISMEDFCEWGKWFEKGNRIVEQTRLDNVVISTVFLALDHSFRTKGPPVLWETMVFGGPLDDSMERYTSHDDALAGHQRWVDAVKKTLEEELDDQQNT